MLLAILAIWFGYKKARDTGRNGVLWGAISGVTFIGVQLLVSLGFGFVIGIGVALWGWNESLYNDMTWVITIVAIVASIFALWLLFRFLDRVQDQEMVDAPPPPPTFDPNDQP